MFLNEPRLLRIMILRGAWARLNDSVMVAGAGNASTWSWFVESMCNDQASISSLSTRVIVLLGSVFVLVRECTS